MKRVGFFEGVVVALAASLIGGMLYAVLTAVFAADWVLRALIAGLIFAYIVYLLGRSRERVGRITTVVVWFAVAAGAALLHPPLLVYVSIHLGAVWLIRSLYFYASVLSALVDLGLNALALAAAIWAVAQSGSVFLAIWCFFLVQALFALIPPGVRGQSQNAAKNADTGERFQSAYRAAEAALQKIFSL